MSNIKRGGANRRGGPNLGRKSKHTFVTKSGQTIKVNQSLSDRIKASRDERLRRRALRLAGMPKSRLGRLLYRLEPKRLYSYWFSREGGIMALKITGIGLIGGFLLLVGIFAYFRKDLPNLKDISGNNIGGSIRYYDRSGKTLLWEDYDAVKRIPVKNEDIAQSVKDATVAVEDKDFFKHGGFDVRGIVRAGFNNVFSHGNTQGGSTITQQLVKLSQNWTDQHTYTRKVKELILSVELERSYSKQEILVGYLNTAPYGGVEYGVEAVSRDMFNKSAKDLTLDEAALLAAMPKSPSIYSPYGPAYDKEALTGRQHYILDLMEQQGMISAAQRDAAKQIDTIATVQTKRPGKYEGIKDPYFVLTAKEQLESKYGDQTVKRGGWKVITTLDANLQSIAEDQVHKGLRQVKNQGGDEIAFAAEDVKTGQMVALVGGVDFSDPDHGQNNYARYRLPPGSSFKPYDYTSLIENNTNVGAGSVLYDTQGPIPGYPCTNKSLPPPKGQGNCLWDYDFKFPGALTLRYALGGSRNIPAVKAMLTTGIDKTIATAKKMMTSPGNAAGAWPGDGRGDYNCYQDEQLTKTGPCYASSAIGDGAYLKLDEHVHGFATISRNGLNLPQTYIMKIEDAAGKTVDEWKPTKGDQAVRPDAAYIVADMLSDPNASYFPAGRKPHRYNNGLGTWKFAMKTGTTNDGKDGWMMGFSTQYSAGVWVGYHNRQRVMAGPMENMTQPIWQGWMDAAHKSLKPEDRVKPGTVQSLPAFVVRNHVGIGSVEPSPSTDLFPSWYQAKKATNKRQTIDIVSNKLATDCTPARARKDVFDGDANSFSIDRFVGTGGGTDLTQTDDVHLCSDAKPTISLSITPLGATNQFQLVATVGQGTHPLSSDQFPGTVSFVIDGQTIQSFNISSPGTVTYNYTANFTGTKTVTGIVVDSVLYDASDSGTITATGGGGGGGGPLTLQETTSGNTANFTWTGGSDGVHTVHVSSTSIPYNTACSSNTNSCSTSLLVGHGSYTAYVDGNGDAPSPTISFSK